MQFASTTLHSDDKPIWGSGLNFLQSCKYHAYNVWLFTASDLKTIVGPSFMFGMANALAITDFDIDQYEDVPQKSVARNAPLVLLYVWINLLPFAINNQKAPDAIQEDALNKPWRTLPSRRMSPQQAERLMFAMYVAAIAASYWVGGFRQCLALVLLGTWYNNFAGGDCSWIVRNLINSLGYVCFTSGALEVALGSSLPVHFRLLRWLGCIAAIIFSTVHLQDMYDQKGDRSKGRLTVPLVFGDLPTRWVTSIIMVAWGYTCPRLWTVGKSTNILSILLASIIAFRCVTTRTVPDDKLTFKYWNVWMGLVFVLPLLSHFNR